jgi:hypothetical protein
MDPAQIRKSLRKRPFQPFRVVMADGPSHDVRDPELAMVTKRDLLIGVPQVPGKIPRRFIFCDPSSVVRIDPLVPEYRY